MQKRLLDAALAPIQEVLVIQVLLNLIVSYIHIAKETFESSTRHHKPYIERYLATP